MLEEVGVGHHALGHAPRGVEVLEFVGVEVAVADPGRLVDEGEADERRGGDR
jgi:hypothetical protein